MKLNGAARDFGLSGEPMKPITALYAAIRYTHAAAVVALLILTALAVPSAQAQTYTVQHAFTNWPDGAGPNALMMGADGVMYGTTQGGGNHCGSGGCGTVYKIDSSGNETVLYRFTEGNDGAFPVAALIQDAAGNLYGNTEGNGFLNAPSTVFKIDTNGNETTLYAFTSNTGCCQDSPLAIDKAGNLYGMSPYGGNYNCGTDEIGCGLLYKLTQAGENTVLHVFTGTDGIDPEGGLVVDVDGNLYGTTIAGGNLRCYSPEQGQHFNYGCGTIYKLDKKGNFTVLHTFTGGDDGSDPLGLIQDAKGNLYGIAAYGGTTYCLENCGNKFCLEDRYGCGVIFEVDTQGKFSVIYRFTAAIGQPDFDSHLLLDSEGNLYGSNGIDGANNTGFIFKVTPSREFSIVASFPSDVNREWGIFPQGVVMDSSGKFYGTMLNDGADLEGTVFKVSF
jgi:uncharacterized repeat protein (TIGR03803 family)